MPINASQNKALAQTEAARLDLPKEYALTLEAVAYVKSFRRQLAFEFEAAGLPLTPSEARVLVVVGRAQGLRQTQLAQLLSCEPMTLVGMLDRLEAAGLVNRTPDEEDRRAKKVLLEASAVPLVRKIEKVVTELCIEAERGLDRLTVKQLRDVFSKMNANLADVAAGDYRVVASMRAAANSGTDGK
jgi:MarR family transcriptional regulator, transcriptional regulator for hemolysin